MAFTIRFCPYCGDEIQSEESGIYVCQECDKRIVRSRTNMKASLQNKPYQIEFDKILGMTEEDPDKALEMIEECFSETEAPNADMYFTRGIAYAAVGEDGKAHNDWKKGLDALTDLRYIDAYIVAVSRSIEQLICLKEREFIQFNPLEYIDMISTEFRLKSEVPCKGVFYITIYRNFRMDMQSGKFEDEYEIFEGIIPPILNRILAYGRNFRTTCDIIEEILEDFHYNPETYIEDDNLRLHLCSILDGKYTELSKDFSEDHMIRIFRHWNDENMFELEYWVGELMRSVKDTTILQTLRKLRVLDHGEFDLDAAVEYFARKHLLITEEGVDLSEQA